MSWNNDISTDGLRSELKLLRTFTSMSHVNIEHMSREDLFEEIRTFRKVVARKIKDKTIPYPSKSDPDQIAVVVRALLEHPRD